MVVINNDFHRYFTMDSFWSETVSTESAIFYGLLKNISRTIKKFRVDQNGEVYYWISNSIINKYVCFSKYKIKELLTELEECGFISVFKLKKNLETYRYIKFNIEQSQYNFDMFYDLLDKDDKEGLIKMSVISWLIFNYNVEGNDVLDFDMMLDSIGNDWGDSLKTRIYNMLIKENLIDDEWNYTDYMLDICSEFEFDWTQY